MPVVGKAPLLVKGGTKRGEASTRGARTKRKWRATSRGQFEQLSKYYPRAGRLWTCPESLSKGKSRKCSTLWRLSTNQLFHQWCRIWRPIQIFNRLRVSLRACSPTRTSKVYSCFPIDEPLAKRIQFQNFVYFSMISGFGIPQQCQDAEFQCDQKVNKKLGSLL